MSQPEATLKKAVREALTAAGILVLNNEQGRRGRFVFGLGKGSADLVCLVRGRAVFLELKTATGKPTADQLAWGALVVRHGGVYAVVRTVGEALAAVTEASRAA